jgi:hypothetical protein
VPPEADDFGHIPQGLVAHPAYQIGPAIQVVKGMIQGIWIPLIPALFP